MGKIYNLKNKKPDEVIKAYKIIALKSQIPKKIWKTTGNYEDAMKYYQTYVIKKDCENNG